MADGVDRLMARIAEHGDANALVEADGGQISYAVLGDAIAADRAEFVRTGIAPGDVVALQGDFDLASISAQIALWCCGCTVALIPEGALDPLELAATAGASWLLEKGIRPQRCEPGFSDPLIEELRARGQPGLVLFTSGVSGKPKAILHDTDRFLAAYSGARKAFRTVAFLLYDHVAGQDTMFYTLHAGGTLLALPNRRPSDVTKVIARDQAEVLPTSPSFLRLMCLHGELYAGELASLRVITYGSEVMDAATLERVARIAPHARLIQKYGATEFGVIPAVTRSDDGRWLRFDETRASIRIRDGILWIKAPGTMMGYLGGDRIRMEDGWLCTGDEVEQDGEWYRITGRASKIINVGGEKVHPSEVEATILQLAEVAEVSVFGVPHPLMGHVVCASVLPASGTAAVNELRREIRRHCSRFLARHKVPAIVKFAEKGFIGARQKALSDQ